MHNKQWQYYYMCIVYRCIHWTTLDKSRHLSSVCYYTVVTSLWIFRAIRWGFIVKEMLPVIFLYISEQMRTFYLTKQVYFCPSSRQSVIYFDKAMWVPLHGNEGLDPEGVETPAVEKQRCECWSAWDVGPVALSAAVLVCFTLTVALLLSGDASNPVAGQAAAWFWPRPHTKARTWKAP